MAYKPSDFFVGAVDIFAVLMPGAVFTAVVLPLLPNELFGVALPDRSDSAAFWVAFVVSSYLFGHLLFAVGATFDYLLYDWIRKSLVPPKKDLAYNSATRIAEEELGEDKTAMNTFQYCRSVLDLSEPGAASEVRRFEADSKFFRSISVVFMCILILSIYQDSAPLPHMLVLIVILVASLCRYGLRRFKSSELAYRYLVAKRTCEQHDANQAPNPSES